MEGKRDKLVARRAFLSRIARVSALFAAVIAGGSLLRVFIPSGKSPKKVVRAGHYTAYPYDDFTLIKDQGIFIFRNHEGIRALSAVCTHLGCIIEKSAHGFSCPCHGSAYTRSGKVISGAASNDLKWFRVSSDEEGFIYVHPDEFAAPEEILRI